MKKVSAFFRLIRPKQWVKNLFVFSALVFSKHLFDFDYLSKSLMAFAAFSFSASFIYIINDIADRERDKLHPKKRKRPIASGEITPVEGGIAAIVLLILTVAMVSALDPRFMVCLAAYLVMNLAYSFYLKEVVLIDVFVIAIGFMLRVVGGAMVIDVERSSWLILTTMFLSLFLAIAKRRGELVTLAAVGETEQQASTRKVLEHYSVDFAEQLTTICAAGFVFCYALYTVSERTVTLFQTENLVLTTPFVLYGVFRYLYLLHLKNLGESPTEIVLTDIPMIVNFIAYAAAMFFIIYV